jgi:hypothetical protein
VLIETKSNPPDEPAKRQPRNRWHAVTLVAPNGACAAVAAYKGKRFLSADAPRLPLPQCDAARCNCKYRHYQDRRGGPRRADEKGAPAGRSTQNRRAQRGRRASD